MGFLDSLNLGNLVSTGLQLYGGYQQQQAQNDLYDSYRAAEDAQTQAMNDEAEYQQYLASFSGGGGGGGGGGGAPKMDQGMLDAWQGLFNKAEAQYKPYSDAGARAIGPMTDGYLQGLKSASGMVDAYSTPEMLQRMNQSVPASSIQYNIPQRRV